MSHSSYSLLSALRQFASNQLKSCERDEQKKQIIDNNGVPTTIIDLVGVCLNVHCLKNKHKPSCVELLIADATIPWNKCVKVRLWGSKIVDAILSRKVSQGTVIRINQLTLCQSSGRIDMEAVVLEKVCPSGSLEVICELYRPWSSSNIETSSGSFCILSAGMTSMKGQVVASILNAGVSGDYVSTLLHWYDTSFCSTCNLNLHEASIASLAVCI